MADNQMLKKEPSPMNPMQSFYPQQNEMSPKSHDSRQDLDRKTLQPRYRGDKSSKSIMGSGMGWDGAPAEPITLKSIQWEPPTEIQMAENRLEFRNVYGYGNDFF